MATSIKPADFARNLAASNRQPARSEPVDLRNKPLGPLLNLALINRTPGLIGGTPVAPAMPGDSTIIFRDLVGRLDMLRVDCAKCGRSSRYSVSMLVRTLGADSKLIDWVDTLTVDCPRRLAGNPSDACSATCPDFAMLARFLGSAPPPIVVTRCPELPASDDLGGASA